MLLWMLQRARVPGLDGAVRRRSLGNPGRAHLPKSIKLLSLCDRTHPLGRTPRDPAAMPAAYPVYIVFIIAHALPLSLLAWVIY